MATPTTLPPSPFPSEPGPQAPSIVTAVDTRAELRRRVEASGAELWTWHTDYLYRGDVREALDAYEADPDNQPWPFQDLRIEDYEVFAGDVWRAQDGEYVAAACPAAVLELLDAIDRVLAYCDERDRLSHGEGPTSARIRAAINEGREAKTPGWLCDHCGCWNRYPGRCKFYDESHQRAEDEL